MRVIFATCSSDEAEALASRLVEERLVGCVNLLPGARSIYRFEGRVCRETEVVMWMETTDELAAAAAARLRALHSYRVPKIVVFEPERCDADYGAWLAAETGAPAETERP